MPDTNLFVAVEPDGVVSLKARNWDTLTEVIHTFASVEAALELTKALHLAIEMSRAITQEHQKHKEKEL